MPAQRPSPIVKMQKGFTLVELIVSVAIVSIMLTGVLTVLNPIAQFQKAQDAKVKADLSQIQKALESYYSDNGQYPPNATNCSNEIMGNNDNNLNDCIEWGKSWQPYMNVIPKDNNTAHVYVYYSGSNGQSYYLYANLNRGSDPQMCQNLDVNGECSSIALNSITADSCGAACNFGVTSPNVSP